ncbi:hypothetical protein QFC21_002687 [Naganishia friedmannii]|uniref:Uncharacterized protein n=1 Tax=Naganishia friedmannii TaxID=89922 RepID=A0ACC2VW23_9TREE|nr:hypothetical protein QFC21_002687 [Naganishia friedmannii]
MSSSHCVIVPTQWEYRRDLGSPSKLDGILNADDQKRISQWNPCSQFPTEIHLKAGIIPHLYKQRNEHKVQWVGKQNWEFRAKLDVGFELGDYEVCELDFEGLNTFATVYLNGESNSHWRQSPLALQGDRDSWATDDPAQGDIDYDKLGGRFVSEFGMPTIPDIGTVDWWLNGDEKERYSQSKLMQQHNRAGSHERRFAVYMNEMFRLTGDFATHIYHTQVLQAEAMGFAYRSWRRQWKGPGKEYLRPKPAYYSIKRELAPVSVGIQRTVEKNCENDRPRQFYEYGAFQSTDATMDVLVTNDTMDVVNCSLEISAYDIGTGWSWSTGRDGTQQLAPNSSTELRSAIPVPAPPVHEAADSSAPSGTVVIRTKLRLVGDGKGSHERQVIASTCGWPQPYKSIDFPALVEQCGLTAQIVAGDLAASTVTLTATSPSNA